ncbi:intermembrane transport protein PqiB [Litoribacillus peritrichatus]|uniref:Mce/MlaD domain-containing protein n=1 Tax=Litoribacillus peritrichatus TaxID=718191 RepID=A0ABP7N7C5_9GAMM
MNAQSNAPIAKPVVKSGGANWFIWLLPAIALAVGSWLLYKSITEAGVEFVLHFDVEDNVDIVPNKTEVRFYGMKIGEVKSMDLSENLAGIDAIIELDQRAAAILQPDTKFWLVKPEVSITQITGLDTIVSGRYITFQFGPETSKLAKSEISKLPPRQFEYDALKEAPPKPEYLGGLHLKLKSSQVGSIPTDAPVYYKKILVGHVEKSTLASDDDLMINVFIQEKYKHLVNTHSRFWNASGIKVEGSLNNLDVQLESLTSLMIGGISFDTAVLPGNYDSVSNHHEFDLYPQKKDALTKSKRIQITFNSGEGLKPKTLIQYQGINIGEVESVELNPNANGVIVTAQLVESASGLAKEGSKFWIVKPEIGLASTKNIGTLLSGYYITIKPGTGKPAYSFKGQEKPPTIQTKHKGLKITLTTPQLGSIKAGVKIYYRNFPVGEVDGAELADNAQQMLIYATIAPKYAPLIRQNTKFWNASGIGLDFSLFQGAKIETESLESLLEGGIAFATPNNEDMGDAVEAGTQFKLYDESEDDWKAWAPNIQLGK